jgi:hypothetical protein
MLAFDSNGLMAQIDAVKKQSCMFIVFYLKQPLLHFIDRTSDFSALAVCN